MVYLIHFDEPYRHAKHYLGCTDNLDRRMEEHKTGQGARLLQVLTEKGIGFEVVRTWEGSFEKEAELKSKKNSPRLCPICQGNRHPTLV